MTLAAEAKRISKELAHLTSGGTYMEEVPWKIHDRGTDDGHGLGGPPLSEAFVRWIGTLCNCGRLPDPDVEHDQGCPAVTKFRASSRRSSPHRLKRALRQLRDIAPEEFNPIYLMFARGRTYQEAFEMVNDSRARRRERPYTEQEFSVLIIAGTDKLVTAW